MNFLKKFFRRNRTVMIWHHSEYNPKSLRSAAHLIGIDPDRMVRLLEGLIDREIITADDLTLSPMASYEDIKRIHPASYLETISNAETITGAFGYQMAPHEIEEVIRWQRRAVGATMAAAQAVLAGQCGVGVNLGGGFHHSSRDRASGFCIFNDVAIAIARLRKDGFNEPIAIVDLDFHQGNGNLRIFAEDRNVVTYSIHGAIWDTTSAVSDYGYLLPPGTGDAAYLAQLKETLPEMLKLHGIKVVFYIAGNDVLAGDRLGNFSLTRLGVLNRDQYVTEQVKKVGAKLVVVLGGGYSQAAWNSSSEFVEYLAVGTVDRKREWLSPLRSKFKEISERLHEKEKSLEAIDDGDWGFKFSEEDMLGDLGTLGGDSKVLDYRTDQELEISLENYGILGKIRKHGFTDLSVSTENSEGNRKVIRIRGRRVDALTGVDSESVKQLLLEMVLQQTVISDFRLMSVQWLLIQDPASQFSADHPQLPGQEHPGLGIAEDIQEYLVQYCERMQLDGVSSVPAHYHNAAVASRAFTFLDPKAEGFLMAIRQALLEFHVFEASLILDEGGLITESGETLKWKPSDQVLPVSHRLKMLFQSEGFHAAAQNECQRLLALGFHLKPGLLEKHQDKKFV